MAQTIKSLIAPLIMMAGLALLPACWGLKRPAPVTVTIAEICGGNPFHPSCDATYDIARVLKISECIAGGVAATATCAGAVAANSCIRDPFVDSCTNDSVFSVHVARARNERATYCVADNPNATLCTSFADSVQFDNDCLDSPTGNPVHASCATRPNVVSACDDAPFASPGCGNIPNIEVLRILHCEDSATAWDDGCVEETYAVATAARNTACLTHGINADAGGHADCAGRANVLAACSETSPFALPVCDAVGDIITKRETFCLKTDDNNGENPFNDGCVQDTHGDVSGAQEASCLANVDVDDGCVEQITPTCTTTPLAGVSCAGLDGHKGFLATFCAKGTNFEMRGCSMTPAAVCRADPFGVMVTAGDDTVNCSTDTDYDSNRQARCAAGMDQGLCDTVVIARAVCASSGANANPFVAFCTGTNNIVGSQTIAQIRQAVVDLCLDGANPAMAVCVNTDTLITDLTNGDTSCEIGRNAFTDRCVYSQFNDERTGFCGNRLYAWNDKCNAEASSSTAIRTARDLACTGNQIIHLSNTGNDIACAERSGVIDSCPEMNPFRYNVCDDVVATTINPRRAIYCNMAIHAWKDDCTEDTYGVTHNAANAQREACVMFGIDESAGGDASCTTNYADWNGSFMGGDALATAPVSTHTTNQFLSGLTATALTGFTPLTTSAMNGQAANATTTLTLADTDHGFGGQADDGLAFYGAIFDSTIRYYAGIYTDTDVGLPLTDASQNGVWRAWMRTSGKDPENEAFELTVDFNATMSMGTLKAFFRSTSGTNTALYYNIDGMFGPNGVITGNVAIGTEDSDNNGSLETEDDDYTLGVLTGLIGAQGVVAAFVSNTSTITADDNGDGTNPFVGGFVGVPTVAYADWNVATSPDAAVEASPLANQFLQDVVTNGGGGETSVTLNSAQYSGASLGGEAADGFAYKTAGTSPDFVYYVGILPSTDLGLSLNNATQAGAWNGSFVLIEDGAVETTEFILTVTFGGAGAGKAGSISATIDSTNYSFMGEFNSSGVIDGTVTHADTANSTGPLQGLIGQDGAVGVFISNAGTQDFGGGFVARKP